MILDISLLYHYNTDSAISTVNYFNNSNKER